MGLKYPVSAVLIYNFFGLQQFRGKNKSKLLRGCQQGTWQTLWPHLAFLWLAPQSGGQRDMLAGVSAVKGVSAVGARQRSGAGLLHFAFHS